MKMRAHASSPIHVMQSGSALRRVALHNLFPYNRKTNCTNNVISTKVSKRQYTRTMTRFVGP